MSDYTVDPRDYAFKKLIHNVAKQLTYANCKSLAFLYGTKKPGKHDDIPGLEVMEELLLEGFITCQDPDSLEKVLIAIDRHNLVRHVTKYKQDYPQQQECKQNVVGKSRHSAGYETDQRWKSIQSNEKLISLALFTLEQTSVSLKHLEKAVREKQLTTKQEVPDFAEVKKCGELFIESLMTLSSNSETQTQSHRSLSIEESKSPTLAKKKKPVPPPKPKKKSSDLLSLNSSSLPSLRSGETGDINSRSSSSSRSEDEMKVRYIQVGSQGAQGTSVDQESQTGDSGFNDDDSWGKTALPMKPRRNAFSAGSSHQPLTASSLEKEDPDYDQPWLHAQETDYTELSADTREEDHTYS